MVNTVNSWVVHHSPNVNIPRVYRVEMEINMDNNNERHYIVITSEFNFEIDIIMEEEYETQ